MTFTGFAAVVVLFIFLALPIAVVTLIFGSASRFVHRKRQFSAQVIVAAYDAPGGLTPAEVGYLYDSRIGHMEFMATLFGLEQLGLLTLAGEGGISISPTGNAAPASLRTHEQYVLNQLNGQVNAKTFVFEKMIGFAAATRSSLAARGLIKTFGGGGYVSYLARRIVLAYFSIVIPLFILLLVAFKGDLLGTFILIFLLSTFGLPFFVGLAVVGGFIYNKLVGQPGLWTPQLKLLWPDIAGYRDYVRQVELGELKFESDDLKTRSTNSAMPFAVALGLNTNWQKRFIQ